MPTREDNKLAVGKVVVTVRCDTATPPSLAVGTAIPARGAIQAMRGVGPVLAAVLSPRSVTSVGSPARTGCGRGPG